MDNSGYCQLLIFVKQREVWFNLFLIEVQMSDKKTEQVAFRTSTAEKAKLEEIAEEMCVKPGVLAGALVTQFIKYKETHGERLIWPPQFNYYPAGSESVQQSKDKEALTNESSEQKAG